MKIHSTIHHGSEPCRVARAHSLALPSSLSLPLSLFSLSLSLSLHGILQVRRRLHHSKRAGEEASKLPQALAKLSDNRGPASSKVFLP